MAFDPRKAALLLVTVGHLAAATPGAAQAPTRSYDAPTVEQARRSIQGEIALAKKHSVRRKPLPILNATTTTTPEIEHVETGARCRFWYGSADISFPWLDDRALDCSTSYDWVSASLGLYSLAGPSRPVQHVRNSNLVGLKTLPEIVGALAQEPSGATDPSRRTTISPPATFTTAAGRPVEYIDYRRTGPGGGPDGTKQIHYQSFRVALIDGWVVISGAYGAGYYRKSLDDYAQANFSKVIASMEESGRLPTFRNR